MNLDVNLKLNSFIDVYVCVCVCVRMYILYKLKEL